MSPGWTSDSSTFLSFDGKTEIFWVHHRAPAAEDRKRTLLVLHGLGEHGGRYRHLPHHLHKTFDHIVCMDHRGHGRSQGLRGHVEHFDDYVKDVTQAVALLERDALAGRELHLLGHSMGGHIALRTLLKHPELGIQSANICAPLLGIRVRIPWLKKQAGLLLARVWGDLHMSNEIDPRNLSHDLEVVRNYEQDRLVHNRVTPRFFVELNAAMADTLTHVEGYRVPVQFLVPLEDEIVDPDVTQDYFSRIQVGQKQLKTYPGFFHEALNEIGKEKVFQDIATWAERWRALT